MPDVQTTASSTAPTTAPTHGFTAAEQEAYERDGFVVRHDAFTPDEIATMADECEALVERLITGRKGRRYTVGSYVFDPDLLRGVMIKWEGDTDVVHGIEPFAHLSPELRAWGLDARLVEPMRSLLGRPDIDLFTEKLNLKRPRHGGPNPLHQDHPYWIDSSEVPSEIATTIVYLDDATVANGCTWVVPGSHRQGQWQTRRDTDEFGQNEIDEAAYPEVEPIPVEVAAGATVSFGAFLVHQSTPNTSEHGRRALLYSYQPSGRSTMLDSLRTLAAP